MERRKAVIIIVNIVNLWRVHNQLRSGGCKPDGLLSGPRSKNAAALDASRRLDPSLEGFPELSPGE